MAAMIGEGHEFTRAIQRSKIGDLAPEVWFRTPQKRRGQRNPRP
jgi:hypothetical protein